MAKIHQTHGFAYPNPDFSVHIVSPLIIDQHTLGTHHMYTISICRWLACGAILKKFGRDSVPRPSETMITIIYKL
jgi:hypothetical protein